MYNLNYAPTTLGVQSRREIISGGTRTKNVEYHCSSRYGPKFRKSLTHKMDKAISTVKLLSISQATMCNNAEGHNINHYLSHTAIQIADSNRSLAEYKQIFCIIDYISANELSCLSEVDIFIL
jgi:hypothetical protein